MKLLVVVAVFALAGIAAAAAPTPAVDDDVAATLGAKWGHWTLERLNGKREEIKSDIVQAKKEKTRVKEWGAKVAVLVREIGSRHVQAAKERVAEWTDILAVRRGQRNFHVGRKAGYDARHNYIVNGPKGRRAATDKKAWCAANPIPCDRWRHERRLYNKHKHGDLRNQQAGVTAHSRKRVAAAKAELKKAVDALAAARKWRTDKNASFAKRAKDALKPWNKRLAYLYTELKAVNAASKKVRDTRAARLATYKPFYMTKCRYIGGKHHMYYCFLDTNNADKAKHKFRVCKKRGPEEAAVGKLKFRCYK